MPFSEAAGYGGKDFGVAHFLDWTDLAGDEGIEEAIVEAGEEWGGEVEGGEDGVVFAFTWIVY